jgi:hypothetical protein
MNFFQNFSQSLAICFELFYFREFVYSEIADSGPHLSAAALTPWFKATVGTVRRASQQLPRLARAVPDSRLAPLAPDRRLACAARLPTARLTRAAVPTAAVRSRQRPVRRRLASLARRRRATPPSPRR